MKKAFLFLSISLLLASCSSEIKNDLFTLNLKDSVKSTTSKTYTTIEKFGKLEPDHLMTMVSSSFLLSGNISTDIYLSYKWKSHEVSFGWKNTYNYDENNLLSDYNLYNENGKLISKSISKHDNKGNEIEYNDYNPDGSLLAGAKNKYDSKGRLTENTLSDKDGNITYSTKTTYNSLNQEIKKTTVRHSTETSSSYTDTSTYQYNKNGDNSGSQSTNDYSNHNTYTYDENGNWTTRISTDNRSKKTITIRTIEYYQE